VHSDDQVRPPTGRDPLADDQVRPPTGRDPLADDQVRPPTGRDGRPRTSRQRANLIDAPVRLTVIGHVDFRSAGLRPPQ